MRVEHGLLICQTTVLCCTICLRRFWMHRGGNFLCREPDLRAAGGCRTSGVARVLLAVCLPELLSCERACCFHPLAKLGSGRWTVQLDISTLAPGLFSRGDLSVCPELRSWCHTDMPQGPVIGCQDVLSVVACGMLCLFSCSKALSYSLALHCTSVPHNDLYLSTFCQCCNSSCFPLRGIFALLLCSVMCRGAPLYLGSGALFRSRPPGNYSALLATRPDKPWAGPGAVAVIGSNLSSREPRFSLLLAGQLVTLSERDGLFKVLLMWLQYHLVDRQGLVGGRWVLWLSSTQLH